MKMDKEVEGRRVSFYDWLRIIATFCVVVGHSFYLDNMTVYGGIDYLQLDNAQSIYQTSFYQYGIKIVAWIYGFHMPLFFFLSGAVLRLNPLRGYFDFVKKKIKRLWIPYIGAGYLFMLPIKFISGFYNSEGLLQAVKGLWRGIDSGHLWFLTSLLWDMIIFGAIYKVLQKIHLQKAILLIALVLQCMHQWIPKDILGLVSGVSMLFWFALGYEFEGKREYLKKCPAYIWVAIFGLGIILDVLLFRYDMIFSGIVVFIRGFLACVLAYGADRCLKVVIDTRIFKLIIAHLFDIYLYHDPLEYLVLFCFFRWNLISLPGGMYILVFIRIFGVILLSIIIGCVVERTGIQIRKKCTNG